MRETQQQALIKQQLHTSFLYQKTEKTTSGPRTGLSPDISRTQKAPTKHLPISPARTPAFHGEGEGTDNPLLACVQFILNLLPFRCR